MPELLRRSLVGALACSCPLAHALADPPAIAWTASYNGPGSYWESVSDAAVRDGCCYVVGFASVTSLGQRAYATVKYETDGTEAWSRLYEGPTPSGSNPGSAASAVAVDAAGNVYVTGYSATDSETDVPYVDAATLKYGPDGEFLWERRHRGAGGNEQPLAIALDPAGFLYVSGASWIGGGFDVFLLKYDLEGNLLWERSRGQPVGQWDAAFTMGLAPDGDIVLGGYTERFLIDDLDLYILEFGSDGSFHWEWTAFGGSNVEEVWDLAVDAEGNTYALAQWAPPGTPTSLRTVKLDAQGTLLWSDVHSGNSSVGDYAAGIELAPDGTVFVAGAAWENGSQNAMTLIKYTPGGQRLWVRSQRGGYFSAEYNDMAVDADGAAYLTGFAFDENNREDYLTAKYDGSGNLVWTAVFDAPEGRSDIAYQVRVGADRRVYVVGDAWRDFANYYDMTTVAYDQGDATGVPVAQPATELRLSAHPNPTLGSTLFTLSLPRPEFVKLSIYDAGGRRVREVAAGRMAAGTHSVAWDGRDPSGVPVSAGVYLARLTFPGAERVVRVTRLR